MRTILNAWALAASCLAASVPCNANGRDHRAHAHAHAHHDSAAQAPAGVMFEHMHGAGGAMVGYRMARSRQSSLFFGSENVNEAQLLTAGFSSTPQSMTMQMHMLDIMYAPADWLNLMLMPQFMSMDMSMTMHGDGHHGGHESHQMGDGNHHHGTSGLGDTIAAALVRVHHGQTHKFHAGLGVSVPTGSVDQTGSDGLPVHYGMQLGSGTWDLLPSLTYSGHTTALSWGAQVGASLPLESTNESGFRFGERYYATGWTAYPLVDWASASLRLQYSKEGPVSGHYQGAHNHSSPGDLQANYGHELWDVGVGVNVTMPSGTLAGHRLSVEWLEPVSEHYRGYQLGGGHTLRLNWVVAF